MSTVIAYTDGGCRGHPGVGGWGVLLKTGEHERRLHGHAEHTTNNRMELTAAIEALKALKRPCAVTVYTDSTYVQKGITEWMANWQRRNWKTAAGKPVKNADLWRDLLAATEPHTVEWRWVKGHAGDPGNEEADRLANLAMDEVQGPANAI